MENHIKALISYYLFIENLKEEINQPGIISNSKNTQCYLVEEKWMKNYFNVFLYDEVNEQMNKMLMDKIEKNVENIYERLDNYFLEKINEEERKKKWL